MKNHRYTSPSQDTTASLARSITWKGSKQTYFTAGLLVDKDLTDDCYRAYAYFRWADDVIDAEEEKGLSRAERCAFIRRQQRLVHECYEQNPPDNLRAEEKIVAALIFHDRSTNPGLASFIDNFLALLAFDAARRGGLISQQELTWYSNCLARAVTDGIQYFIGNEHPYPATHNGYHAVFAAHVTHMLRDLIQDVEEGYINVPREYLKNHHLQPQDIGSPQFRAWVRSRVELARSYLREGKRYLRGLPLLRSKIAGFWYCARYEGILDTIERDEYVLRREYKHCLLAWFRIAWLGISVTVRHFIGRLTSHRQDRLDTTQQGVDPRFGASIAKHQKGA
jgi:phytoene/squalene synthetase